MQANTSNEQHEQQALPPMAHLVFLFAALALLLFLVSGLWFEFGFTPAFFIILAVTLLGTSCFLFTRWRHHQHDIKDRAHMRE